MYTNIYVYMVAAVRVSLFRLQTKTNSADAFPEDELLLEDGLLPEDELGRRTARRQIAPEDELLPEEEFPRCILRRQTAP